MRHAARTISCESRGHVVLNMDGESHDLERYGPCSVDTRREGSIMHDTALWTSWYVVLLLFPFMILVLMVRDFLSKRTGRR